MYVPDFEPQVMTPEDSRWAETQVEQGKWQQIWGNVNLGIRLDTSVGAILNRQQQNALSLNKEENRVLQATEWQKSPYYRQGMRYKEDLTVRQAKLAAESWDDVKYQEYLNTRSSGVGAGIAQFAGRIGGNIVDPLNFIPIAGPTYRIAKVAKIGGSFLKKPVVVGAIEDLGGMALAEPFVQQNYEFFEESRNFGDVVMDLGLGAAFGAGLGALIGKIGKGKMPELEKISGEMDALEQANATKTYSQAVDQVANGDVASIGQSGLDATNSIAKRISEEPVEVLAEKSVTPMEPTYVSPIVESFRRDFVDELDQLHDFMDSAVKVKGDTAFNRAFSDSQARLRKLADDIDDLTGKPDGTYEVGTSKVTVKDGVPEVEGMVEAIQHDINNSSMVIGLKGKKTLDSSAMQELTGTLDNLRTRANALSNREFELKEVVTKPPPEPPIQPEKFGTLEYEAELEGIDLQTGTLRDQARYDEVVQRVATEEDLVEIENLNKAVQEADIEADAMMYALRECNLTRGI